MGFKVGQKYRTNDLSFQPGGVTVEVHMKNNRRYEYDKIKNPSAYIKKMLGNPEVEWARVKKESSLKY
jgi:hypothetical protein